MDTNQHKTNWIIGAFQEPVDRINETYYFDKRDKQFFSVFITDYFLLADKTDTSIQTPYSNEELKLLEDRVNRIEVNDNSILPMPRLTIAERKDLILSFCNSTSLSFDKSQIQTILENENGRNTFDLAFNETEDIKKEWLLFKSVKIIDKAETFCNLNSIDIDKASIFTDAKATTVNLDLDEPKRKIADGTIAKESKPWWKFW